MKVIDTILYKYLAWFIDIVAMILLSVLVIIVFIGIGFRYLLDLPLAWANELSQFLLVWLTFFGAAAATRRAKHLRIEDILNKFQPKVRVIFYRVINLFICIFLIFMIIRGFTMAGYVWTSKSEALQLSNGLFYLPLAIGFILMLPYNIRNIFYGGERGRDI